MAYDDELADRVRALLEGRDGLGERRMFGGLAFLLHGHLAVAVSGAGGLMLRADPGESDALLGESGVTRMVMRGRPMAGWLRVEPAALASRDQLARWVDVGASVAGALPPKPGADGRP